MKHISVILVSLLLISACNNEDKETGTAEAITETSTPALAESKPASMPSFAMMNSRNETLNLESFKGKKVLVNLWATWCGPCRAEIPSIQQLAAKTNPDKVAIVMLSLDDDFETAKDFASKTKMNLPVYFPAGQLPILFTVEAIPTTFIFNEKGELIHRQVGADNYDSPAYIEMLTK
jgi:thiol-disulfide isomerase/thioredoxin